MNKLRKPRAADQSATPSTSAPNAKMSRTMQLAVSGMRATSTSRLNESWEHNTSANLQRRGTWFAAPLAATPHTIVEQYWAARALVAETLLSARDQHQEELTQLRLDEEEKRQRDIATLVHATEQRQKRFERFMGVIIACLVILLGFTVYVVMRIMTPDRPAKGSNKPSHFTIPILSPFTSVVENETGVFGTKAVAIFMVVIAIALFVTLKRRIFQWPGR